MTLLGALLAVTSSYAQVSPVGLWRTSNEKTGEPKAEVRIAESAGVLTGRIVRRLRSDAKPDDRCDACPGERKGQPYEGLEIIRQVRKAEGKDVWEGGRILDPESGREYGLRLTPVDEGQRLEVRGSIGPFGRTQTWVRVQ